MSSPASFRAAAMFVAIPAVMGGCMYRPTDDGRVASTTAPLRFDGYTMEARAPVQVRAWNFTANTMDDIGAPARAGAEPFHIGTRALYGWTASHLLAPRYWRSGPAGGQCAVVGATTVLGGWTYDVMTLEPDWGACFGRYDTLEQFFLNCQSSNMPVAKIYTNSWGSLTVDQARLDLAGLLASGQVILTLDNFTPNAYQFCTGGNPAGCPPGLSGDPETYKFYAPAASSLATGDATHAFSITPSRSDPMTVYIDDLTSTSLDFRTEGNRFILGIDFESSGPEIRMNCIRNIVCSSVDGRTIEFAAPRAELSFALTVDGGRVAYTDVAVTFTTGSGGGDAAQAGAAIGAAMREKLTSDSGIRSAVSAALDAVIRGAAGVDAFPMESIAIASGTITVVPGCPQD
jgi:hypothetical protein